MSLGLSPSSSLHSLLVGNLSLVVRDSKGAVNTEYLLLIPLLYYLTLARNHMVFVSPGLILLDIALSKSRQAAPKGTTLFSHILIMFIN